MDRSQISTFESFSSKETNEQFKLKGGGPETIEAIQDSDKQAILRYHFDIDLGCLIFCENIHLFDLGTLYTLYWWCSWKSAMKPRSP